MRTYLKLLALILALPLGAVAAESGKEKAPKKASDLFKTPKVWTLHLTFTPKDWETMEPKNSGRGAFGGGPGGGMRGGPGGFGPAEFIAPAFLKLADKNQDGRLSADEFHALAENWFTAFDKEKRDKLSLDQLRNGLGTTLAGALGMPGGGGGRMGGPNLQGQEGKRNGLASAAGFDFVYVHADMEFQGQTIKDVGVRYKGNGTWMQSMGQLKRSLKIDTNHFVKGQKFAGVTKINLHSNVTDASWMNEVLSLRLYRDAGVPAPHTAYARVYITVPGKYEKQYVGLYSIVEDIDKRFEKETFATTEGAIFKPVTPNVFADLGSDWTAYKQTYDPKTELTDAQKKRVIDFAHLLTAGSDAEFNERVAEFIDLDETSRYFAVTVWLSTLDSILAMGQNFYVYLDPATDKFKFMPWDLDHSFGQFPMGGSQEQRENLSINRPWRGDNRFLERLFKVESFKKLYLAHQSEFSETIFKPKRFHKQVDELAAALRPAVKDESAFKLERFDKVVSGKTVEPARFGGGGGPGGPGNDGPQRRGGEQGGGPIAGGAGGPGGGPVMRMGGFGQSVKPIKGFVDARAKSVADQLAGKSEGLALNDGRGGGPGGPGGPGAGLAQAFASVFMNAFDANHDGQLTHDEFVAGLDKWFVNWNFDKTGQLTEAQLKAGIAQDLIPGGRAFGRGNAVFGGGRGNPGFPSRNANGPAQGNGPPER